MPNLYKNAPYMPHYVTPRLSGGEVGAWGAPASNFVRGIMAKDGNVVYSYTYYAIDLRWLSAGGDNGWLDRPYNLHGIGQGIDYGPITTNIINNSFPAVLSFGSIIRRLS